MNTPTQRQTLVGFLGLALLALALFGCSSSDGGVFSGSSSSTLPDMSGNWTFSATGGEAPSTTTCTGDLAGFTLALRPSFVIALAQVGANVSGSVSVPCPGGLLGPDSLRRPGSDLSFDGGGISGCVEANLQFEGALGAGTVSGDLITTIDGRAYRVAFTGLLEEDNAVVTALSLTGDGLAGSCSVSGSYLATR